MLCSSPLNIFCSIGVTDCTFDVSASIFFAFVSISSWKGGLNFERSNNFLSSAEILSSRNDTRLLRSSLRSEKSDTGCRYATFWLSESSCCLYFSNSLSRSNLSILPSRAASYTRVIASAVRFFSNRSDKSSARIEAMDDDDDDDRACFLLLLLTRKRLPRNTADITPAIDEPAMTAISVDII